MKNLVGISMCDNQFEYYLKWIESENIDYLVLDYKKSNSEEIKRCRSLLLSGGNDIHPSVYNGDIDLNQTYRPARDEFEFKLFDYAIENQLPILGICRGMQLINLKLKGKLITDIKDKFNVSHEKMENGHDRTHNIKIIKGTILNDICKSVTGIVNSSHHQGVEVPGEGLVISAYSDDGIPEAIEWKNSEGKPFLLGIQWHPERMSDKNSSFSKNILLRLIKETEKRYNE